MSKHFFAVVVAALMSLCLNVNFAAASPSVCDSNTGCVVSVTGTSVVSFYETNGTMQGGVTYSSSVDGYVSTRKGEHYMVSTRGANVNIYNVATGANCWQTVNVDGGHATLLGNSAYVVDESDNKVFEIAHDCSSKRSITSGGWPWGITNDGQYVYTANQWDATLTQIDPVSWTTVSIPLGLTQSDGLVGIAYHAGTNALYVSKANEVLRVDVGTWNVSQLVSIPGENLSEIYVNNDYLVVNDATGGHNHLINIYTPSPYTTISGVGGNGIALSDDAIYACGVDIKKYDYAGNFLGTLTTDGSQHCTFYFPTNTPSNCGNSQIDNGEVCDGANLGTSNCLSFGFVGGTLACNSDCQGFDTSGCSMCGNDWVDSGEDCDGAFPITETCTSLGFDGGPALTCTSECHLDTSQCFNNTCGNSQIDNGEDCDGSNLNGQDCTTIGQEFVGGTLRCDGHCRYDTSSCVSPQTCGNGSVEFPEDCDGGDLNSDTEPDACRTDCTMPRCGDGVIDPGNGEQCDGDNFGTDTCQNHGFVDGLLTCNPITCQIETASCTDEVCDPDNLVRLSRDAITPDMIMDGGDMQTMYEKHLSDFTSDDCVKTCVEDGFGALVTVIRGSQSSFCNFESDLGNGDLGYFHAYAYEGKGPEIWLSPEASELWPRSGGVTTIHVGDGSMTFTIGQHAPACGGGTLGTKYDLRTRETPDHHCSTGIRVFEDSVFLEIPDNPDDRIVIPVLSDWQLDNYQGEDRWVWINEEAPSNLSRFMLNDITPPKPPGKGCNQCSTGGTIPPLGTFLLLVFFLFRILRTRKPGMERIRRHR